jgi:hypothetical protein
MARLLVRTRGRALAVIDPSREFADICGRMGALVNAALGDAGPAWLAEMPWSPLADGRPAVIPSAEGQRTTPSVVAFASEGERLVGQLARRQAILSPKGTTYSAKRFIGRRSDEVSSEPDGVAGCLISAARATCPPGESGIGAGLAF